ncbi:hypothetical protein C1H46_013695 [Malus baccata]|uniref:Uncharacterized protein n=1 Tax=Malus baccata TaxID=106549 RepID=A0A540MPN2_MALBA|nr:hypothetical protein C1H46_013695 [Malus baccata]
MEFGFVESCVQGNSRSSDYGTGEDNNQTWHQELVRFARVFLSYFINHVKHKANLSGFNHVKSAAGANR